MLLGDDRRDLADAVAQALGEEDQLGVEREPGDALAGEDRAGGVGVKALEPRLRVAVRQAEDHAHQLVEPPAQQLAVQVDVPLPCAVEVTAADGDLMVGQAAGQVVDRFERVRQVAVGEADQRGLALVDADLDRPALAAVAGAAQQLDLLQARLVDQGLDPVGGAVFGAVVHEDELIVARSTPDERRHFGEHPGNNRGLVIDRQNDRNVRQKTDFR